MAQGCMIIAVVGANPNIILSELFRWIPLVNCIPNNLDDVHVVANLLPMLSRCPCNIS
jgi:hypothetical protein